MRSLNRVELIGNLTKDGEMKYIPSGTAVTKFTVATNRKWKDKHDEWQEETQFTNCVLWAAENLSAYLLKGTSVFCEGRLSTRKYEKDGSTRYLTEVVVDNVILLGAKKDGGGPQQTKPRGQQQGKTKSDDGGWGDSDWGGGTDDDAPF